MDTVLEALAPHLTEVIAALFLALFGIVARLLAQVGGAVRAHLGVRAEAILRDALHSALRTGVNAALTEGLTGRKVLDAAVTHVVERGAPDAVAAFGLDAAALRRMAGAYLPAGAERT